MRACAWFLAAWLACASSARADAAQDFARRKTELELQDALRERESTSRLFPVLVFSLGTTSFVLGATLGTVGVLSCDRDCSVDPLASFAVVAGVGIAMAGAIWWVRTEHELSQLELRVNRLTLDLESLRPASVKRDAAPAPGPHAAVTLLRGSF